MHMSKNDAGSNPVGRHLHGPGCGKAPSSNDCETAMAALFVMIGQTCCIQRTVSANAKKETSHAAYTNQVVLRVVGEVVSEDEGSRVDDPRACTSGSKH